MTPPPLPQESPPTTPAPAYRTARQNPFSSERMHGLPYQFGSVDSLQSGRDWLGTLAAANVSALADQFLDTGGRAAIVGPHGHGKSTLLAELGIELQRRLASEISDNCWSIGLRVGTFRIPESTLSQLRAARNEPGLILLDGAEQLSGWRWRSFRHLAGPRHRILLTAHKTGYLPTLWECRTSVELLEQLVEQLTGPLSSAEKTVLHELFAINRGDLRLCLRELYDRYAAGLWPAA